jgi:large subunit ribosomal protein L18
VSRAKRLEIRRTRRAHRVRKRVRGTSERPRVSVHRTNLHVYAQVIDDEAGRTLCEASSRSLELPYGGDVKSAGVVGESLAKKAAALAIKKVAFDRGRYRYHGRVKALAEALRRGGLEL